MFIDQAKIFVKAGDGGRGCYSFYQDKYTRHKIPNGGDGGRGADIIFRADRNLHTLLDFRYNRHFYGKHGEHGSSNNKKGKDAPAIIIRVPVGTLVKEVATDCVLRDLDQDGQELLVARGGKGGIGNDSKRIREALPAGLGDEKELALDLKLIADVGVVGFPNVGKSTLISNISNAHPKVAAYPFTTKSPVLGVVRFEDDFFVIADIPGLIEGSSTGKGLGDKFLRHIERTKILVHLIDMPAFEGRDPVKDYKAINLELKQYNAEVAGKLQILVANKMDLEGAKENLARFKKLVKKKIYPISALEKQGLEELIEAIAGKL
ncbi:MAG: GTPase ObgE [Candidatus Omnitrophota bacterium]